MEDFEEKVKISEAMDTTDVDQNSSSSSSLQIVSLLRQFLAVQQRRAEAYAKLKKGFTELGDSAYQQLCNEITVEFSDCSKEVLALESTFLSPDYCRNDLASLLRSVQVQEKQKLHLTATVQVLKKAGRPSERLVSHENCKFRNQHECVHVHEITEAAGTEEAEADAEYDNAMKEAIQGVQDAVTTINEHLEEVRYEIAALEEN
ncbi:putative required for excision 1-B domain-containing protein [Helianthus debilis subsp. tardiflorus]